jgi:replication-associated recombination protein RarA
MKSLTEKYRPKMLADMRGNLPIVAALKSFVKNPCSKAFLLSGPAGTGKTSAAFALAGELGCDMATKPRECGGLFEIASGELTADNVREMFRTTLAYRPFYGSGWKVVIANEADNMSNQAQFVLLDILENLPPQTVVVFTTNDPDKLPARFRQRCECHVFKTPVRGFEQVATPAELAAQGLIDDVWRSELGHNHAPMLQDLDGWNDAGNVSFRSVLSALEPLIRAQRDIDAELASKTVRGDILPVLPENDKPVSRVSALAEMAIAENFFKSNRL